MILYVYISLYSYTSTMFASDICKGYKVNGKGSFEDIPFTATYRGKFDSAVHASKEEASSSETSAEDVVVDVEAVAE